MSNVPVPADESAILDAVVRSVERLGAIAVLIGASIRNRLTALKKDRNDFTSAQDVMSIYNAVLKQGALRFRALSPFSLPHFDRTPRELARSGHAVGLSSRAQLPN